MALGADRYASRGDTFAFLGCVLLSVAAMSLPERIRDPLARGLRQTVLAPFLTLQQQTELLSASRSEEHTSELQSRLHLVCRLLLEKKKEKELPLTSGCRQSSLSVPIAESSCL